MVLVLIFTTMIFQQLHGDCEQLHSERLEHNQRLRYLPMGGQVSTYTYISCPYTS